MSYAKILILPSTETDPFDGTKRLRMLIQNHPSYAIRSTQTFVVASKSGEEISALVISPLAVATDYYKQGYLLISASHIYGPLSLSILFDDGTLMTKELLSDSGDKCYMWPLCEEDCENFLLKKVHVIRAETPEIRKDYYFDDQEKRNEGAGELLQLLIERFLEEAARFIEWVPSRENKEGEKQSLEEAERGNHDFESDAKYCYVYLMKDTANGYFKIGMSYSPELRESTLQSEKPTIEKVCQKKFPSRKIARGIEATLHRIYEEQRIRGEWFKLNERDVWEIKQTLL